MGKAPWLTAEIPQTTSFAWRLSIPLTRALSCLLTILEFVGPACAHGCCCLDCPERKTDLVPQSIGFVI